MQGIHIIKRSIFKEVNEEVDDKTMLGAIKAYVKQFDVSAIQIFTHGPRNSKPNAINYDNVRRYCRRNNICIAVHLSYMSNIWKNTSFVRKHILDQINAAKQLDAIGVVVHLPREYDGDMIERTMLSWAAEARDMPIILETECVACNGGGIYETPQLINDVCERLKHIKGVGICIDTAHIWASGANISTKAKVKSWLGQLSKDAVRMIKLIHLNGSTVNRETCRDIHAIAGGPDDKIWSGNKGGMLEMVRWALRQKICIICEINRGEYEDAVKSFNAIYSV